MNEKMILRPVSSLELPYVDSMFTYSFIHIRNELGYPNCQSINEFLDEIDDFENTIDQCLYVILFDQNPIGLVGLLYTNGDSEAILIGPIINERHLSVQHFKQAIALLMTHLPVEINKIEAIVSQSNHTLMNCLQELDYHPKETQVEMVLHLNNPPVHLSPGLIHVLDQEKGDVMEAIFELLNKAFYWDGHRERFDEMLKENNQIMYAKNNANTVIGAIAFSEDHLTKNAYLEYVVVHEAYRHQGIGQALINHMIQFCYDLGNKKIYLYTGIDNAAISLYEKVGFQKNMMSTIYETYCF